jgi:hypothetical protein
MPFDQDEREALIDSLSEALGEANRLVVRLKFRGKKEEAGQAARKARELSGQIDRLLTSLMDDWLGRAAEIQVDLETATARLQAAIDEIGSEKDSATSFVTALSLLDDVINIAARLVA